MTLEKITVKRKLKEGKIAVIGKHPLGSLFHKAAAIEKLFE